MTIGVGVGLFIRETESRYATPTPPPKFFPEFPNEGSPERPSLSGSHGPRPWVLGRTKLTGVLRRFLQFNGMLQFSIFLHLIIRFCCHFLREFTVGLVGDNLPGPRA
jgi:hypothetical protein